MKTYKEQYGKRMRFAIAQLTGILFLPLIAMAEPTLTDYYWMTNSAGRCVSGSFSDSSKWIGGAVPGELSLARFFYRGPTSGDGGYTVTLPTMETKATLRIYARNDIPIVFDGSGSIFHATSTDANNYGEHFLSIYGGGTAPGEGKEQAYFMNSSFRGGYKLTDAVFTVKPYWLSNGALDYVIFQQGIFNFYDPEGVPLDSTFVIGGGNNDAEAKYVFNPDSTLRINGITFLSTGETRRQTVRFNGNTHYVFGDLWFNRNNDVGRISAAHVDGGSTLYAGRLRMSNAKPNSESGYTGTHQMFVENGGTLICSNGVDIAAYGTQLLAITNGANATFGTEATMPLNKIMGANHSSGVCYSTNTLFVKDSTLTMVGTNEFSSMDFVLDNAIANFGNSFSLGKNVKGRTHLSVTNSTMNFGSFNLYFGNDSGHRATVDFHNAKLNASGNVYFGRESSGAATYENNSLCDTTVDGAESDIALNSARNGSRLTLGSKGSSIFRMKDGAVSAYYLLMAADTSCVTSILHQTGGKITVTGGKYAANETPWYGFNVNDSESTACPAYCHVILDGGEICAHRFYAKNSRTFTGHAGWSRLDANGGAVVGIQAASADNNITVKGFDEANLGERGLTIRSDYETRTAQDFRDMEGYAGRGLLRLEGAGTKKLYGTNSTESVLMCAGGKTLFVPNVDTGANASHYSNVIVTNGATLSIAGDQTAATFRSVALTRGVRLEMEKSDRIVVDGLVTVGENMSLDIADEASVGSYPLVVSAGEASTESCLNWRRAVVAIPGSAEFGVTPVATYDATAGKTTFSLEITEGGPLTGDVTWDGVWNATGADRVTFAGGGTSAVSVDSNVTVGALAFDSSVDYTLSGVGTLAFSDRGGYARVDVARGEQTISARIDAPSDLTLAAASGAKLVVDGEIVVGGIVKEGRGTVSLENDANDLSTGVTVKEGLLTASTPDALGKGPLALKGGTLEIIGAGTVDAPSVSLATEYATTAAVVKVEADVRMSAPSATQGAIIKRGAGRLTLTSDTDVTICGTASGTLEGRNDQHIRSSTTFDNEGGYGVDSVYAFGGFNVAEGELVLRGTAPDVAFSAPAYVCVGIGTSQGTASPGLVVDHATLACSGNRFLFGNTYNSSFAVAPYLIVTNKATLTGTFICGRGAQTAGMVAKMLVDDSLQFSNYKFYPMYGGKSAEYLYRNGSALYVNNGSSAMSTRTAYDGGVVFNNGPATLTFSNSVLARKTALASDVILPVAIAGTTGSNAHAVRMRGGSTLYSNWVTNTYATSSAVLTIGFDDSEWKPIRSDETGDFTFDFPPYETVRFEMEGRGVILSPADGNTFAVVSPFVGDGGMRKRGAGTLAFACKDGMKSWDFGGTLSLEEGTVTLAAGAVRTGAKTYIAEDATLDMNGTTLNGAILSGSGTVANGTLASPTLLMTVPGNPLETMRLTLAGGVAMTGRLTLDFGRTAENPLAVGMVVAIATLESAFDPSTVKVRVVNAGSDANDGKLFVENGVLYCTLSHRGLCVWVE